VISALEKLGISAHMGKRNELLSGKRKISGTASHVFKTRVLHHGTLLYDTDLGHLSKCLYVDSGRYRDKAVKSIRSEVVNLRELINDQLNNQDFFRHVFDHIRYSGEDFENYVFGNSDLEAIRELARKKFSTWEWNYGYSPKYEVERTVPVSGEVLHTKVFVNKGMIDEISFGGTMQLVTSEIEETLRGTRHRKKEVSEKLSELGLDPGISEAIVQGLFF
jgi:lipoate-protein ligase A